MRQRGYEQVKKFSWDRSAAEVLAGYEEVVGQRPMVVPMPQPDKIHPMKGAQ
jgi:hypothetical protein